MLKIGSNEIIVLMSIHFLQKVEKKEECKNADIVSCCAEYDYFNIWNTGNDENDCLVKSDLLSKYKETGIYSQQIMNSLSRLVKKELIVRTRKGYYGITDKGFKEYSFRVLKNRNYQNMLLAI